MSDELEMALAALCGRLSYGLMILTMCSLPGTAVRIALVTIGVAP